MSNGNPQKQLMSMTFSGGYDQQTAPKRIANGKLVRGENIRLLAVGQADKRPGNAILTNQIGGVTIDVAGGGKVHPFRDEIVVVQSGATKTRIGSYAPSQTGCVDKGAMAEATLSRVGITNAIGSAHQPDVAYGNGVIVSVWSASPINIVGDLYATVKDATTGAEIVSAVKLTTGAAYSTPRVCFVTSTNTFVVLYINNGAPQTIIARTLAAPYTSFAVAANVRTDSSPSCRFEVVGLADRFALVYTSSVDSLVHVYTYGGATPLTQIATQVSTKGGFAFGLVSDGTILWASYSAINGGATYDIFTEAWNQTTLAQTVLPITVGTLAAAQVTMCTAICLEPSASGIDAAVFVTYTTASGIATAWGGVTSGRVVIKGITTRRIYWGALASKPFRYLGKTYAFLYYGAQRPSATWASTTGLAGGSQVSLVLCDMGCDDLTTVSLPPRPVAQCAARVSVPESYASATLTPYVSSVITTSTGVYSCVSRIIRSLTGRTGLIRSTATFADKSLWQFAELGDWLHATPGVYYDSSLCAEIGFYGYPEQATIADSATAGGLVAASVYSYIFVYEWADGSGIHRSIASASQSHTMGAGKSSVDITIPCLTLTQRQVAASGFTPSVGITVYRSIAGAGAPYYRVFSDATTPLSVVTSETITFNDGTADSAITSNPQVYTGGSVIANVSPPSLRSLVTYRGRLFGIGDDGRTLWFSKSFVEGDAVAFADEFTISVDTATPLTALAVMDGNLIVFSTRRIWIITGEGPSDTDQGYDYGSPSTIASDVGCSDPRSVVVTPDGVMFQNGAGRISLLTRALELVDIGFAVWDLLVANPFITSAVVHPAQTWVTFTCLPTAHASTGIRLVYDYRLKEWVSDIMRASVGAVAACARQGQYYDWLDANGNVWTEDSTVSPTSWLDSATWVAMTAQFRLHAAGVQGFQRVSGVALLSERYSAHDLTVSILFDYQTAPAFTQVWSDARFQGFSACQQIEIEPTPQECEDILITITDAPPTGGAAVGTGRGGAFVDCTIGVEPKPDTFRLPPAQRG